MHKINQLSIHHDEILSFIINYIIITFLFKIIILLMKMC